MVRISPVLREATFCTLICLASSASAQNSSQQLVVKYPFFGYDSQPIDASVIGADSQATTLSLNCRPGTDGDDCGLFPYQTLTVGPSTYFMDTGGDGFTGTQDCETAPVTAPVCTESAGGSGANFPGSSTTTYGADEVLSIPVTITAGVNKLQNSGVAASTTATATLTSTGQASASDSNASADSATAAATSTGAAVVAQPSHFVGAMGMAAGVLGYLAV